MSITYKDAGVDIEAGDTFVKAIAPIAKSTHRPEVIGSLGSFSGLFHLDKSKWKDPLLVAATDGVGTKLKLAFMTNRHNTVGIDLVAMSVNDLVVCGAESLFFLDYLATSRLDPERGKQVVGGIAEGCRQAGCALLGGETAEMPGFYQSDEYDLAGFAVGIVDRQNMLGPDNVKAGDVLLGMASSGVHSNGFSLVRKVFFSDEEAEPDPLLMDKLLTPTRIYVKPCLELKEKIDLHALAHITGGGLPGNLPRALPRHLAAEVNEGSWTSPEIFKIIQQRGKIVPEEMLRTFNMGIGMVALIAQDDLHAAQGILADAGIESWAIGLVRDRREDDQQFSMR